MMKVMAFMRKHGRDFSPSSGGKKSAMSNTNKPITTNKQILQTSQTWDGIKYHRYPTGQPQLTVLRITIPPNTALHRHHHPVISVGYVLAGNLTIEKRDTGERDSACRPTQNEMKKLALEGIALLFMDCLKGK